MSMVLGFKQGIEQRHASNRIIFLSNEKQSLNKYRKYKTKTKKRTILIMKNCIDYTSIIIFYKIKIYTNFKNN